MKTISRLACTVVALFAFFATGACNKANANTEVTNDSIVAETTSETVMTTTPIDSTSAKVKVETTLGSFTILLYGDTPGHRDNFLKLVADSTYNGTLFHRVINQFMVQAGDPDSKNARPGQRLGAGDIGYTQPAEIVFPKYFHKRGALAAARQGDQVNPERRSSGCQFYVVTGRKYLPAQLDGMAQNMVNQQKQTVFQGLAMQRRDEIVRMQQASDTAALQNLQDELIKQTEAIVAENPVQFTEEMKHAYTTVGGAPHLDGQYTVFGEVIEGMDVIDKIEKVETDGSDRPKEDVKIVSMQIID